MRGRMATFTEYRSALLKGAELFLSSPRLFLRILALQARRLRRVPPGSGRTDVCGLQMELDFSLDPVLKLMYLGVYEPLTVETMRRLLRPGDVVLDVGANVGYLTAAAAGFVGPAGEVHAFEPEPACFKQLQRLCALNPLHHIVLNNCAAGDENGTLQIHIAPPGSVMGSTVVPGLMPQNRIHTTVSTHVVRLDDYIRERGLKRIALVKIDVEGFELRVLEGLRGYLETAEHPPIIICEVTPAAYPLMKRSTADLAACVSGLGYSARKLVSPRRPLNVAGLKEATNIIMVPERGQGRKRFE